MASTFLRRNRTVQTREVMADKIPEQDIPLRNLSGNQDSVELLSTVQVFETPQLEMPETPLLSKANRRRQSAWETVRRKSSYLLRSMGFSIILGIISMLFDHRQNEDRKVVVQKSFWVALGRCWIHLPALGGTIALFYLNLSGFYIGSQLSGPSNLSDNIKFQMLQYAAKAHELFILGSTGTLVFHMLRTQLLEGRGLPLGLIASGFSFPEPMYFLSREYVGAMLYYRAAWWLKVRLFGLLGVAGIIALSAGPSSAILMLPRNTTWPTGNIDFYINGTANDLWPDFLTPEHLGGLGCNSTQAVNEPSCAAGGYSALYNHYTNAGAASQWAPFAFDIQDSMSRRSLQGSIRNDWVIEAETWTRSPHVATAAIQEAVRQAWNLCLRMVEVQPAVRFEYSTVRNTIVETQIPVVRTVCVPSTGLSANDTALPFPVLPEYDFWGFKGAEWSEREYDSGIGEIVTGAPNQRRNGPVRSYVLPEPFGNFWNFLNTSIGQFSLKSVWVTLPPEFESSTAGFALLFPPESFGAPGGRAVSCSVDARWANGTNWVTNSEQSWQWEVSGDIVSMKSAPLQTRDFVGPSQAGPVLFLPKNDSSWRRISASTGFLQGAMPTLNESGITTLERILIDSVRALFPDTQWLDFSNSSMFLIPFIEHVVATVVADSIARTGSYLQHPTYDIHGGLFSHSRELICDSFSTTAVNIGGIESLLPVPTGSSTGFNSVTMETSVEGYAYLISGFTMIFSMIVLIVHALLAIIHICWILSTRRSSSAWDRIPELVVLAQNSGRADVLRNTAGGMVQLQTFGLEAQIRLIDGENLELVWRDYLSGNDDGLVLERVRCDTYY